MRHLTSEAPFVLGGEIAWESPAAGLRRQILAHGPELMIVRVEFEPGAVGALHRHPHRQATYVSRGRFAVTVGNETRELTVGDCFYTAADVEHGVTALEAGELIDTFTPVRADFLVPRT